MSRWLVLETAAAAQLRAAELSAATGYPRAETSTDRAVLPVGHADGRGALGVGGSVWSWVARADVEIASLLTDTERASLHTDQEMTDAGWFPQEDPI